MTIELKMPALSPTMEEGTLAKWLVQAGDYVKAGDVIAEIETDKATMEFEAIDEGRIAEILVDDGTDGIAVGTIIATLVQGETGMTVSLASSAAQQSSEEAPSAPIASLSAIVVPEASLPGPAPTVPIEVGNEPSSEPTHSHPFGTAVASPLATRIAHARNIDLRKIAGTGPRGRIVKKDLDIHWPTASQPATIAHAPEVREANPPAAIYQVPDLAHEVVKMSNMRKTIARRLTESKQQVPHIYLSVDIDVGALVTLRSQLNEPDIALGHKLSVNDMVIKALALALIEVPACNVQFAGDQFFQFQQADISVAVSIQGGLITPVISAANGKSLSAIAAEMRDLAERARAGKLKPHEFQGGTASLSNLGMFGITDFAAVINPPQAMIMAVGAAEKRAVVKNDVVSAAMMMTATGSFDHRVIDGADAAAFMQAFRRLLEHPLRLV